MKAWASKVADNRCKSLARADHAEPCDRDEYHDVQEIPDPDPGCPSARRSGVEQLRRFRAGLPACPIIGYGDPRGSWCRKSVRDGIGFVATLQRGVNDGPDAVRMALLRAADCDETERLLDRMRDRLPNAMHGLLDAVMHESLTRCSVAELAATMGLAPRTLQRRCRAHRLPRPKRLLALALVFHVERLACWSGHRRGPTALALGFSDATDYTHLVKRTLGITPTEVARRGGPAHVAHVMLENLGDAKAAAQP